MTTATEYSSPDTAHSASSRMSSAELRAGGSLASVFALRMLGLFLMSPVFAIYAKSLAGGDNAVMVGIALGMFSLVQACCQIPFGMASDRFGRKPVIIAGLILFILGALICAEAHTLTGIIIGRGIQGFGAISAAITALVADSTREEHRTKAMAMIGGSIGITFALAMVISPLLYQGIGMSGMFLMTAVLALGAIGLVIWVAPDVPKQVGERVPFSAVLKNRELMRLNFGVFVLHLAQMAMFVVVPSTLVQVADIPVAAHWKIYLPVMFGSFIVMLPAIFIGEKYGKMKQVFVLAIGLLLLVQAGFWQLLQHPYALMALLFAFFVAFNVLEASQPSLVSRIAPPAAKGAALGVYNTLQAFGMACGGALGGVLMQYASAASIFLVSAVLTLIWLIIALNMPDIPRRSAARNQE